MKHINITSGEEIISRILVEDGLDALEDVLHLYDKVYAVMDRTVAMNCPASLRIADILNGRDVPGMLIEASEGGKTMDTVMEICSWLLEQGADRDALVLAIGGGITSDMVGFAASIYKRGVRFAYIPTTLLAQVDAAIGGKTGVNFEKYKNILGIIRQPEFTYLCPQVLESLSQRDFLSGVAEALKTFIIEDNDNYGKAVALFSSMNVECCTDVDRGVGDAEAWADIVASHSAELTELIYAAASVKAGVVSRDQFEKGERRKLNLGHTFAHAIETLARKKEMDITHGEAVAMGIIMAAELSENIYSCNLFQRLEDDFFACGLPVHCPFIIQEMAEAMKKDKKAEGTKVHFILPVAVGDVRIVDFSVEEVVSLMAHNRIEQ